MQQFLKPSAGITWAQVVATQLFKQFLVAMNHSISAPDVRF